MPRDKYPFEVVDKIAVCANVPDAAVRTSPAINNFRFIFSIFRHIQLTKVTIFMIIIMQMMLNSQQKRLKKPINKNTTIECVVIKSSKQKNSLI
jgi:hypothetical protein